MTISLPIPSRAPFADQARLPALSAAERSARLKNFAAIVFLLALLLQVGISLLTSADEGSMTRARSRSAPATSGAKGPGC